MDEIWKKAKRVHWRREPLEKSAVLEIELHLPYFIAFQDAKEAP
jgi:hypothetical protein